MKDKYTVLICPKCGIICWDSRNMNLGTKPNGGYCRKCGTSLIDERKEENHPIYECKGE